MATQQNLYKAVSDSKYIDLLYRCTCLFEENRLGEMGYGSEAEEHAKGKIGSEAGIEVVVGVACINWNTAIFSRHCSCTSSRR